MSGHKIQIDGDTGWQRVERLTQIRKEHNLNQQQDLDLGHKLNTADSETEICKAMARMVVGQETNMAVHYGTKQNQLN